jgi:hypothetical protein
MRDEGVQHSPVAILTPCVRRRHGILCASSTVGGRQSVSQDNLAFLRGYRRAKPRIDVVELGGGDERVKGCRSTAAFIGAGKGPVPAPDRYRA